VVLLARIAGDGHGCGLLDGMLLDLLPGLCVGPPGVRGGLLRGQRRRHIAHQAGIDRGKLHLLAVRPDFDGTRVFAEGDFDAPDGGGGIVVAPGKLGRDDVRRIDGSVDGDVDCERGLADGSGDAGESIETGLREAGTSSALAGDTGYCCPVAGSTGCDLPVRQAPVAKPWRPRFSVSLILPSGRFGFTH
jgi:hypothetical protein